MDNEDKTPRPGNGCLKVVGYAVGAIVLLVGGLAGLFVVMGKIDLEPPQQVIRDVKFGGDRNTLLYRVCPDEDARRCRIALYDIPTGKAYRFETPPFPRNWRWPSASADGGRIVVTELFPDDTVLVRINLGKGNYREVVRRISVDAMPPKKSEVFLRTGMAPSFAKLTPEYTETTYCKGAHRTGVVLFSSRKRRQEETGVFIADRDGKWGEPRGIELPTETESYVPIELPEVEASPWRRDRSGFWPRNPQAGALMTGASDFGPNVMSPRLFEHKPWNIQHT